MLLSRRTFLVCLFILLGHALMAQRVGFLLGTFVSDRWYLDQKLFSERITELGGKTIMELAYEHEGQVAMAKKLIADGIDVLVMVPLDGERAAEVAAMCKEAGIPLISYDRLVVSKYVDYYISYDNEEVGRMQGRYFAERMPKGKYVLLNGPPSDNNAILLRKGLMGVLKPYIDKGDITVIADHTQKNWSEIAAYEFGSHYFAKGNQAPDVVIAGNDALANGFIQAMPGELRGKVQVCGQDADLSAIRNIISGSQAMTIYKPIKVLAHTAAEIAMDLAAGKTVEAETLFTRGDVTVKTTLLRPRLVDKSNYSETVVKDGHLAMSEAYHNVGQVFEAERHRIQLALLQKEKALEAEQQINVRNTFLGIICLFILSFAGLCYTIYQKQNDNKLLNEQKSLVEKKNDELVAMNEELQSLNEKLHQQKEEISEQHDAIALQNKKLAEVNAIIGLQKDEIQHQNARLEQEVEKRTAELVQHIRQLEQYSFVTAHNLRAPVARIIGLCQLIQMQDCDSSETRGIIDRLATSSQELDLVFRELSTILDIRTFSMEIFSPVNLAEEVAGVLSNLQDEVDQAKASVRTNFEEVSVIMSIRPYIKSILFNLISNALKYRHPERQPQVCISSQRQDSGVLITVADNGLGISPENQDKIFQLYRRFHFHVEGRGVGLFLVKTQVDSLGGSIEIESMPDLGTTVRIWLNKA